MNPSVRTPALVCAVLSAAQVVVALLAYTVPALGLGLGDEPMLWSAVLLAFLHVQQLAAVVALARSGLLQPGVLGRTGLWLTALGGVVFLVGELLYVIDRAVADIAFGIAPIASGAGMILVGVAVLQARRWTGPARFLPLAVGAFVVVVLTPVLIATAAGLLAIAAWAALWLALGIALAGRVRAGTAIA